MTTAIISGIAAISAAAITALVAMFVTLRSKKLEMLANSEERKAASLERGYNTLLAAADLCWHYRCHGALNYYGIDPPFDWDQELPKIKNQVEALFFRAVDLLKANSLNYESIAPSALVLFQVTWDAQTVTMMEARPDDYESARQLVIEMSRIDARLTKPVKKQFWKKFSKKNRPSPIEELSAEDKLRRAASMIKNKQVETVIFQDDGFTAFIESFQKNPPIFAESLARTASRVEYWRAEKVISDTTLCESLNKPCYEDAQAMAAERSGSEN
ncbi:hypothetical protein ACH347_04215 [Saccharopolyspora sp. 5N102]|uniref:hypothetical protein n=1 Tax=Saccharopolyspora sp. 5N102 TaxID=3375155 RepID=UPI0037BDF82D